MHDPRITIYILALPTRSPAAVAAATKSSGLTHTAGTIHPKKKSRPSKRNRKQPTPPEELKCPLGFSVRSPGSWLGESWVSALLIQCLHLRCDLAVVWLCCFCFMQDHTQFIGTQAVAHNRVLPFGVAVWGFVGGFVALVWFCCCFGWFPFGVHPLEDSGLRNGPHSTFDSPMRDVYSCMFNSFTDTYIV